MLNGSVTLFWRESFFREALAWLRQHSYTVAKLDAAAGSRMPIYTVTSLRCSTSRATTAATLMRQ